MESGNLYDYPRESIERRKLVRQLRRTSLQSGMMNAELADDELYGCLLDLEKQLAGFEDTTGLKGA